MKNIIFPFFDQDVLGVHSMIYRSMIDSMATVWEKKKTGIDVSCPEIDIYNSFLKNLENYFSSDSFSNMTNIINTLCEGLDKKFNQDGIDIIEIFIQTRDAVINNKNPDRNNLKILRTSVGGDDEDCRDNCACLFRWFGFDFEVIRSYFLKISKLPDNIEIKDCFYDIATKGIRTIVSALIKVDDTDFHKEAIRLLRAHSERFCLYIKLLSHPIDTTTPVMRCSAILYLMEAAYDDGKIVREMEIYEDQSLQVMASLGTSFTMKEKSKPKNALKVIVEDFVESEYENKSQLSTKDMKELILSKPQFSGLKPYIIEGIIRKIKKKNGLDDRKK